MLPFISVLYFFSSSMMEKSAVLFVHCLVLLAHALVGYSQDEIHPDSLKQCVVDKEKLMKMKCQYFQSQKDWEG